MITVFKKPRSKVALMLSFMMLISSILPSNTTFADTDKILGYTVDEGDDILSAAYVIDLINNMGTDRDKVFAARDAYNNLPPDQQLLVTNLETLNIMQGRIGHATSIENYIISGLTDESALKSAWFSYKSAPNEVKILVRNSQDLFDAYVAFVIRLIDEADNNTLYWNAKYYYNELSDEEKLRVTNSHLLDDLLVNIIIDLINNIEHDDDSIFNIRETYNNLSDEQKQRITNYNLLLDAEVNYVINLINKIGYDFEEIGRALMAYDSLLPDQQTKVTNYDVLLEKQAFVEEIYDVYQLIENIYVSDGIFYGIEEARAAYNALPNGLRAYVINYDLLIYIEYVSGIISPSEYVIELINNMGSNLSKIEDARYEYDYLSEEEQELVTNYSVLVTVEGYIEQTRPVISMIDNMYWDDDLGYLGFNDIKEAYNALSEEAKVFVTNYQKFLDYEEYTKNNVQDLINLIDNMENDRNKIEDARDFYDYLFEYEKSYVTNYDLLVTVEGYLESADEINSRIYSLADGLVVVNSIYIGTDLESSVQKYNELIETYELLSGNVKVFIDLEQLEYYELFMFVNRLISSINGMGSNRTKIEEARNTYDNLKDRVKVRITNYNTLTEIENYIEQADEIIEKINNAIEHKEDPAALMLEYSGLHDKAKQFVTNYSELVIYHQEYINDSANYVIGLIEALIEGNFGSDVIEARDEYDKLSVAAKAFVTNYQKLLDIEAQHEYHSEILAVIELILHIEEDNSYIAQAREAYDKLSEQQKAKVTNYSLLVEAEFRLTQANYTINYYFNDVLDSSKAVTATGTIGNTIIASDYSNSIYELDTTKTSSTTMILTSRSNVLNIYLKTKVVPTPVVPTPVVPTPVVPTPVVPTPVVPTPSVPASGGKENVVDNLISTNPYKVFTISKEEELSKINNELKNIISSNTNNTDTLVIQINLNNVPLSSSFLETIKDKNVDLIIKLDGYTWTIQGKEISDLPYSKIDLTVSKIDKEELTNLAGKSSIIQLKLAHEGPFNFNSELKYFIGTEYKGQKVYLNYFNPETNLLEQIDTSLIDEFGYVHLNFSHASYYVITKDVVADITAPVIKISKDKNNKVKITAIDESGMKELLVSVNNSKFTPYVKQLVLKAAKNKLVIKAVDKANNTIVETITYTVKKPSLIKTKTIKKGKTYQLDVKNDIPTAKLTYTTSNKKVATVSKTGKITAKAKGKVTITTKVTQNGETFKFKTTITVK